jgi:hypothetical protein
VLTVDTRTGDLLGREIEPAPGVRRMRVEYGKHAQAGQARRPYAIDFEIAGGETRGRFLFAQQAAGARVPPSRLAPQPEERLISDAASGSSPREWGTLSLVRCGPQS